MKIINLETSFTLIKLNNNKFFYSYGTLVAINNIGTIEKFSKTTSKHVNKHCYILNKVTHKELLKLEKELQKEPIEYLSNLYK